MMKFRTAYAELLVKERKVNEIMISSFPIGSTVHYSHGKHMRTGTVHDHGYKSDLRIVSPSNSFIWIDASRIYSDSGSCSAFESCLTAFS